MEKLSKLQSSAVIKIPEGMLEEFKQQAAEIIKLAKEKDTGTLRYDWFLNSDQTECEVREEYKNSEALIEHIGNLGANISKLFNDFPIGHFNLYGDPSPQLLEMIKGKGLKVYSFLQGFK